MMGESSNSIALPTGTATETQVACCEDMTSFCWSPIEWSWIVTLQLTSAILGIVGNSLVVAIFLFQRRRRSRSTDILIGGLACADFTTSLFLIPIPWPWYVPKDWLGEVYCRIIFTKSLLWISITASTYTLMSISVERYIAIVYPLHFKYYITRHRVSILIVTIWVLSVLSGLFIFLVITVDPVTNKCTEQYDSPEMKTIIAYYWFCLRLVLPCLAMLLTQVLIARQLNHQSRNFKGITNIATDGKKAPSFHIVARNRVLKTMLIIILIYIVCWTPNQIAYLGFNIGWIPQSYLNSPLHSMLTVLGFYNSCANPFIYAARDPEFRYALKNSLVTRPKMLHSLKKIRN